MRVLHESLWHLADIAQRLKTSAADEVIGRIDYLASGTPEELLAVDLDETMTQVSGVLTEASRLVRGDSGIDRSRQDLAGADLRATDLRAASLRGAVLIAADLREQDLTNTDLLGADTRDTVVRGANLSNALYLTQARANALIVDERTQLPSRILR